MRARIMPGKASVTIEQYFDAFAAAVDVFGRNQVSTYILAGLGDSAESIVSVALCSCPAVPLRAIVPGETRNAAGAGKARTVSVTGTVTEVYPVAETTTCAA